MSGQLLTNATGTGAGSVTVNQNRTAKELVIVQVDILTGTATVIVQGRVDSTMSWVDLATFTASGGASVAGYPELRANVTANTGATINAVYFDG